MNKTFSIELCKEDAQRIIYALSDYKWKCLKLIDQCDDELSKETAWLEWSYAAELLYLVEDKFDVELW